MLSNEQNLDSFIKYTSFLRKTGLWSFITLTQGVDAIKLLDPWITRLPLWNPFSVQSTARLRAFIYERKIVIALTTAGLNFTNRDIVEYWLNILTSLASFFARWKVISFVNKTKEMWSIEKPGTILIKSLKHFYEFRKHFLAFFVHFINLRSFFVLAPKCKSWAD